MTIGYVLDSSRIISESFVRQEITALRQRGYTIFLIPLRRPSPEETQIRDRLEPLDVLPESPHLLATLVGAAAAVLLHPVRALRACRTVRCYVGWRLLAWSLWAARQVRRRKADRLHAHFAGVASVRAMVLARIAGLPFSCTAHGSEVLLQRQVFLPDLVRHARPFITVSQYNKQKIITDYHLNGAQIEVIHCGVDLTKFQPRARTDTPRPLALSVTWLIEVKGIDYLLHACQLLKQRGREFACLIVGGGRDERDVVRTQQEIERLDLTETVTLVRRVPHPVVQAYLQQAALFVLPSLSEGIPVALMEAMAMELPVIATRITGIPELVDDGLNGLLVEPKDAEALADRMAQLMDDPALRRRLGRAAREKIERTFSLDVVIDRLDRTFVEHTRPL